MKRNLFLSTAAVLVLGTGIAMAQSSPGTTANPAGQPGAAAQGQPGNQSQSGTQAQSGNWQKGGVAGGTVVSLQTMMGKDVYGSDGQKIGSIEDFILDPQTGEANVAVIERGGVLGIGGKNIAVDYPLLSMDGDRIVVKDMTQAQAEAVPEFKYQDNAVSLSRGGHNGQAGQTQNQGGAAPATTPKQ